MIEGNIVFRNNSHNKQASPSKQLAVALRRLCTESSVAASCMSTAQIFGVSEGTVVLYTKRVVKAWMDIWCESVHWHTERDKRHMKIRMTEDQYNHGWQLWQDCVGVIDGTFLPFAKRPFPQDQAVYYWNHRKKKYGLQATIVT